MVKPRELALQVLHDVEKQQAYLNISFQNHMEKNALPPRDTALAKELCYGVMQWKITLDACIGRLSSVRLKKLSSFVICILRLGLYQLFFMDKIPASAAVNESVKLAGKYAAKSRGFVNAVLRRAAQEGLLLPEGNHDEALSIRYSHPQELVRFFRERFGLEKTLQLLQQNNETPPIFIRSNNLKTTREALKEQLTGVGVSVANGPFSDSALLLEGGGLQQLAAYQEGLFTVQDQSAQLAALALSPEPDQRVFDVCAAPGGKTTHMAELMENKGEILALDIYAHRLAAVLNTAKRLGITIINTRADDATQFTAGEKADKILVDAPCSGLGVIRRRPDLKYKEGLTDFNGLIKTQLAILSHCADLLKPGGEMVYSTCTVNPDENEGVIAAFLKEHENFSLLPVISPHITGQAAELLQKGMATFYPSAHAGDGFFIAKLKKEKS